MTMMQRIQNPELLAKMKISRRQFLSAVAFARGS